MKNLKYIIVTFAVSTLVACAGQENMVEEFAPEGITEAELNQPLDLDQDAAGYKTAPPSAEALQTYHFPQWSSSMGITQSMYNKVRSYYDSNWGSFSNRQYVVIIDMGLKSNVRRFILLDLKTGTYKRYLTSHGQGSDKNNDGYLESFSNTPNSKKTSEGFYKTVGTYQGSNGYSLRLSGLSSTNSNAMSRAIVVHGAAYVRESAGTAGRSWGCPALDKSVSKAVIDKIKGGALMYIGSSRAL